MTAATEPNAVAGELCRFVTEDGLELHGFLTEPAESLRRTALVHVHGWDGNFYENRFIYHAARTAVSQGLGFFTFNNRGHDYIADLLRPATGDYVQTGGIYERLSDCRADIRAALGFLRRRSYRRVILQGHSHGAIKVAHFLTRTLEQRVVGLVLLSPSDDLAWGPALIGVGFNRALGRARRLAGAGRDRQLMPAGLLPYPVSAGAFLDSFAPDSVAGMFNLSRTVHRSLPELGLIRVPVLFVVGTTEEAFTIAPEQFVAAAREAMTGTSSFTGRVLEGAPHNYLGHERAVAAVLRRWLAAHRQAWSRP